MSARQLTDMSERARCDLPADSDSLVQPSEQWQQ
jgi:hypothetical protein